MAVILRYLVEITKSVEWPLCVRCRPVSSLYSTVSETCAQCAILVHDTLQTTSPFVDASCYQ